MTRTVNRLSLLTVEEFLQHLINVRSPYECPCVCPLILVHDNIFVKSFHRERESQKVLFRVRIRLKILLKTSQKLPLIRTLTRRFDFFHRTSFSCSSSPRRTPFFHGSFIYFLYLCLYLYPPFSSCLLLLLSICSHSYTSRGLLYNSSNVNQDVPS